MRGISYCRSVPLRLEGRARSAEAAHCSRWRRELLAQIGVGRKESEKPAVANLTGECCYFHAAMNPQRTFQELHAMRPSNVTLRALRAVRDCSAHIVLYRITSRVRPKAASPLRCRPFRASGVTACKNSTRVAPARRLFTERVILATFRPDRFLFR